MEKHTNKSKIKLLKFLPKVAQAVVSFQNPPFSPGRDHNHKLRNHYNKGFSGPMIPIEARMKSKTNSNFEITQDPTSPKVSCIGQIKCSSKNRVSKKTKQASQLPRDIEFSSEKNVEKKIRPDLKKTKKPTGIKKMFSFGRKSDASIDRGKKMVDHDIAPGLSQMRRFASSRDTFANFDWTTTTAQIAPDRDFYSDDERAYSDDEEDEFKVPFSAPILLVGDGGRSLGLEPRKEINLWKRRTMAQPKPLQLNASQFV